MIDVAHELAVFEKMGEELQDYLLSEVPFWQMQAPSKFPKLSLGLLLLTRARLEAVDSRLTPDQRAARDRTARAVETTLTRWQVAAENKAERELRSRLNLWQRYWDECREQPATCADNYRNEVTQRAIAALLVKHFPRLQSSPEAAPLAGLDAQTRSGIITGDFVWDEDLQPGFPQSDFWFLYGRPNPRVGSRR